MRVLSGFIFTGEMAEDGAEAQTACGMGGPRKEREGPPSTPRAAESGLTQALNPHSTWG